MLHLNIIRRSVLSIRAKLFLLANLRKIPGFQDQLHQIVSRHPGRKIIVFPPGLSWSGSLFQRPQQLARALARRSALVFYFEPYESVRPAGFQGFEENLYLCHVPISTGDVLKRPYVHTMTWNAHWLDKFREPFGIYDILDDLNAFAGNDDLHRKTHKTLVENAHLVLATSRHLWQRALCYRDDAIFSPNGCEYEHFAKHKTESVSSPGDLESILRLGMPLIGYYGALARWFDYDLMIELANSRPDLSFVLIGPDHDGTLKESGLLEIEHVFWLGQKSYSELPVYLSHFDVAVIPFVANAITHAASPLKLFEYFAGGKPVVITPMQESMRYGMALSAEGSEAFSCQIDEALALRDDPVYLRRIDQVARSNTWDVRAGQILEALSGRG